MTSSDSVNLSSVIGLEQKIHLPLRSPSLYYSATTWFKVSLSLSIGAAVLWYLWNLMLPSSMLPTTSFLSNFLIIGRVSNGGFNQKFIRVDCFCPRYFASILNMSFDDPSYFWLYTWTLRLFFHSLTSNLFFQPSSLSVTLYARIAYSFFNSSFKSMGSFDSSAIPPLFSYLASLTIILFYAHIFALNLSKSIISNKKSTVSLSVFS